MGFLKINTVKFCISNRIISKKFLSKRLQVQRDLYFCVTAGVKNLKFCCFQDVNDRYDSFVKISKLKKVAINGEFNKFRIVINRNLVIFKNIRYFSLK